MQTLDECVMSEYIPVSASNGLREIILGCLNHTPREIDTLFLLFISRKNDSF